MIPNIFISSTISDLHHLRDSIRDTIFDLGYNPIMSEYGDIGYLPSDTAEDSCYLALRDCQLAIIIIGKRYGSLSSNGLSVTHNEFQTARKSKVPIIFLVDEEIMSFKKIFEANSSSIIFPGVEDAKEIFGLVKEFAELESNNGLITYNTVSSAKQNIKKQLAHLFCDLLRKQFDQSQNEIKDILTEITTLKHILLNSQQDVAKLFSVTFRELLDEENERLKDLVEIISGSLELGVQDITKLDTLADYLKSKNAETIILPTSEIRKFPKSDEEAKKYQISSTFYTSIEHVFHERYKKGNWDLPIQLENEDPNDSALLYSIGKKAFIGNKSAYDYINFLYSELIKKIDPLKNTSANGV